MVMKKSLRHYVTSIISFANSRSRNKFRDRSFEFFAGRAPPELIKLMVDVWTPIVGPNKEIMVIRTVRPKNMRVLGISLQGSTLLDASESTPDKLSEAAAEDDATATASPSRHFVHSVLPNSLFGQLGCLQRGDEILQVNGYRLHGYSHVEAVRCLRCLPSHIELVIARSLDAGHDEGQYFMEDVDGNTTLQVAASEIGSTLTGLEDGAGGSTRKDSGDWLGVSPVALPNQPPDLRVSEWIHRSHSDITSTKMMLNGSADLHEAPTSPPTSSMSLSAVSKADDSLLSLDNTRMSTLLRSMKVQRNRLDPSGATSMLLPGSDLKPTWSKVPLIVMLRRDTKGFGFSLSEFDDFAVSTTTVRTSSLRRRASTLTRRRTVAGDMNLTPDRVSTLPRSATAAGGTLSRPRRSVLLIDLIQPGGCVDRDGRLAVGDRLLFVNDRKLSKASLGEAATVLQNVPLGYTMIGVAKMKLVHATPQPPVESLSSPQFAALVSSDDKSLPLQDEFAKEYAKDHPLDFYSPLTLHLDDMPYHASTLKVPGIDVNDETVVRVKTNGLPLGLELDALAAGGQDGCRVVKVLRGGAVEKAAALVPGDYITRINSDTLRCVSNAEAFRVLRKVSVECSTIEIAYYPAEKVLDHRAKHMKVGSLGVDSAPEASFNDASDSKASTSAIVSLIEDLPPPELILTTTPLLLEAPSAGACWTQTREIKLLKLPHEATWGIFITGPDMWGNNEDEAKLPPLPPEVSQPVFISKIGDDTAASRCGLLESGDIVIGVNGMDATRVGSRTVAEWLQTANFVSTSASSSSASDNESPQTAEWAFLYLLVLSFRSGTSSSSPSSGRRAVDLQSIPPVALFGDMTSSGGDFDCKSRPVSFLGHPGTLVRSAFISSNESSSMEEPTSVASLEQHGDIPEPLALSDLAITPPKGHDMPPLPANGTLDSSDGGFASLAYHHPVAPPIPSVQTVESQSAWRNIGSTKLTSSLAQLTETYRRPALVDDEIHVVTLSLAAARCGGSSTADCEATLGIRLVGHRDTNLRGVFVCSLREKSLADQTPGLQVTDEIVQVRESR
uniref:Patj homolog n=1 Tax=Mesocestoides corti TaxID=53468 RepID=A0A5K3F432_MESCO